MQAMRESAPQVSRLENNAQAEQGEIHGCVPFERPDENAVRLEVYLSESSYPHMNVSDCCIYLMYFFHTSETDDDLDQIDHLQ